MDTPDPIAQSLNVRVREAELPADVTAIVISPVQPDEMLPGETTVEAMARLRRAVVIRE
ncbi:hypothetical protein AB0875_12620 [Micromonospora gifhornensis]|uniref:hypothetical protein n=1 Tax=Micromonospora gifhornensis TaxID=84594 RepID=UPI0034569195